MDQLKVEFDAFKATLNNNDRNTCTSTTLDSFREFVKQVGLTTQFQAITVIFEQLCKLSQVLDQSLPPLLLGTIRYTLLVAYNKYKDNRAVIEFFSIISKMAIPDFSMRADRDDVEFLTQICCDVVRWCKVFATEGLVCLGSKTAFD